MRGPVPNLASPAVVRRLVRDYGLPLTGRLGQNFLVDGNVADRIVDALQLAPEDSVLEVGPGFGALTQRLLERVQQVVVAVEIDGILVQALQDVLGQHPRLRIVHADARQTALSQLLPEGTRRKAVGNLPYYATSPLLFHLLACDPPFACLVLMVQREVASRMAAPPGGKDYGALSVNVQYRCRVETVMAVPPTVFLPRPAVHSAVVRLTPLESPGPVPVDHFSKVVRAAFGQRRKTLRNALRAAFPPEAVDAALDGAGLDGDRRAESLSVEEFTRLAQNLP